MVYVPINTMASRGGFLINRDIIKPIIEKIQINIFNNKNFFLLTLTKEIK